ncbi:Peptidyl-prolyl cis-trans isomerase A precursor [Mariniflexile rhizosphaerae]|uniref:peptidylprolyl isomerase n=1 Tax=unclassified Mariniflexile TaxID=2643887 RepID=UPI000CAC1A1A|nr:peptidylprolyl isomerase [Mariniflexile sp. TRM1-10]AXP81562.1 Peptidyl-prolyl cis-trans isomerase A precursor [Mariniflexile sp. TRM1-10]PLB17826.1 MAG: Peptidyl-prolyl cis-trans isomerase [Flavobacteriaceae bacterium FS1-H7996/R]
MKLVLLLSVFVLFLNCEDKQSKKKINPEKEITTVAKEEGLTGDEDTTDITNRAFPKLNSKNAMEFFLQYDKVHKENKVRLTTDFGTIDILLFNETKFHRSNFIFLTKQKYFNGTQFYRVIDNFMVQAGNSDDRKTSNKRTYIGKYLLPPDTKRGFKHDRGVVSMPSSDIDNPHKLASPYEFFIVQQQGGAHFLDGDYTIFGKVTSGMDVVDKIAAVETDDADWPLRNVYIRKVEIVE